MDTNNASLILFHDPSFSLNEAAHILKDNSLIVDSNGDVLHVRWSDSPVLKISFARGAAVQQMSADIGKYTAYAIELGKCDACFRIYFEDFEEVLDEINTLIETQLDLKAATGGFLFNTWNGQLLPPEE